MLYFISRRHEDEVKDEVDYSFFDGYFNSDSIDGYNGLSVWKIPDERHREDIRNYWNDHRESVEFRYGAVKAYGEVLS